MQRQDPTHPTGVATNDAGGSNSARARERKANAALSLRTSGAAWDEIAAALGYPTARAALVAVEQALEQQLQDDGSREAMRRMAGRRLERLLRAVWGKAIDEKHPEQMQAVQRARELIQDHSKLFGLPAPTEYVVHSPTMEELQAWVAQVQAGRTPQVREADIFEGEVVDEEEPRAVQA